MRKIICIAGIIVAIAFSVAFAYGASVENIDVNDFESTMTVGSMQSISVVVYPEDAEDKVLFSSDNTAVATISPAGKIETKAKGKANITVSAGNIKKTLTLTVKVDTKKIIISSRYVTLKKGEKYSIKAKVTPEDAAQAMTFTSSDTSVATVSSKGVIKGKKDGEASVFVSNGDLTESIAVIVNSSGTGGDSVYFGAADSGEIAKKISDTEANELIVNAGKYSLVDKKVLRALKETGRDLVITDESYEITIFGDQVINCDNALNTNISIARSEEGINFDLNNGKPLPGEIKIDITDKELETLRYVYIEDESTGKNQYFG